ncbi:hypothetical protein E4K10_18100 [Streptomyces sp. T1317-0309]|nr:hypothetical protein E4K10_18100 [Streptomyces sp. T1317-0309]
MATNRLKFGPLPNPKKPNSTKPSKHEGNAEQLRNHPEQWAPVGTYNTAGTAASMASIIRTGVLKAYRPAGHFEAASRTVDGHHRVYARYIGD